MRNNKNLSESLHLSIDVIESLVRLCPDLLIGINRRTQEGIELTDSERKKLEIVGPAFDSLDKEAPNFKLAKIELAEVVEEINKNQYARYQKKQEEESATREAHNISVVKNVWALVNEVD